MNLTYLNLSAKFSSKSSQHLVTIMKQSDKYNISKIDRSCELWTVNCDKTKPLTSSYKHSNFFFLSFNQ